MTERSDRCANCGALVSPDAEWCGQCYEPIRRVAIVDAPAPTASPTESVGTVETPGGGVVEVADGRASWTCPICGEVNAIEASVCVVCGTPFARLFAEPEAPPAVDPERAAVWSLVFPGLGHWKLGRRADAVARFVLFGWSFGTLCVLIASRVGKGGLGPTTALFLLFAGSSLAIYVLSALDAYRIAKGEEPVVSTRVLLWGSAGLVVLSTLIATLVTLPAARR
jgi:hypothetical protein